MDISLLPSLNAALNATSAALVVAGHSFIRRRKTTAHRACMMAATCSSALFLISYVIYHYHHGATRFAGTGLARAVYFAVLTSHTLFAILLVPMVIVTLRRALRERFDKHRQIARWTFPLWLYVSVTGVAVYFMLYHLYPSR
jgi:putative membrane protein